MNLPDVVVERFQQLLAEAAAAGDPEPTAMTLATADPEGRVSARTVLLKSMDAAGFVFYTNLESRKAQQLAANRRCALSFLWKPLRHQVQVQVEGVAEAVTAAEADAYFATRPRLSQIGAWASRQSAALASRQELLDRVAEVDRLYADRPVPRPPHWGGYRVRPDRIEFWYGEPFRLHQRECWRLNAHGWSSVLLYP